MPDRRHVERAIAELSANPEQFEAVSQRGHCVVLAGPGSGKTKTLTTAMARAILDDVTEPRGVACITYNNECALELEERLARLGVEPSDRIFIGTVHSFALAHVISPYARIAMPELPYPLRVASEGQRRAAVEGAYATTIGGHHNPHDRWAFAQEKRKRDVDRGHKDWFGINPELAAFVDAYEAILHDDGLIDYDDMPLIAYRMVKQHSWIQQALHARFPILFVDEYQDLGHALHELVRTLCFGAGIRLFAVGDGDQSIYAFAGANPDLLLSLTTRADVHTITLKFNYRCGTKIIDASMAALGEERGYQAADGAKQGQVHFHGVDGDLEAQAAYIFSTLVPELTSRNISYENIAVLYRNAGQGKVVAEAAMGAAVPFVRADNQALIKRNSRMARFVEACAKWVAGGWQQCSPRFSRLGDEAVSLVFGTGASEEECRRLQVELATFLGDTISSHLTAHTWLKLFRSAVLSQWQARARATTDDWDVVEKMIDRTDPFKGKEDISLKHFGGIVEGTGRLNLSTLHSAKGREFDAAILFAMNNDVLPTWRDKQKPLALREARRLFYVGVTRSRSDLYFVFKNGHHSPWIKELYDRVTI